MLEGLGEVDDDSRSQAGKSRERMLRAARFDHLAGRSSDPPSERANQRLVVRQRVCLIQRQSHYGFRLFSGERRQCAERPLRVVVGSDLDEPELGVPNRGFQSTDIGLRGAARKCPRIDLCCAVDEARHHLKGREKHRLNERRLPSRQFVQLREDRCGAFMAEEDEGVRASALLLKCLHDADVRLGFVLEHAPIDPGERARVEKVPNKLANRCIQTRVAEHQQ